MSFELRQNLRCIIQKIWVIAKIQSGDLAQITPKINLAVVKSQRQQQWYVQQWWMLLAGLCLFFSIILFAWSRHTSPNRIEADYLKTVDPQIYLLLKGEGLSPPPQIDDQLINAAIVAATTAQSFDPTQISNGQTELDNTQIDFSAEQHARSNTDLVNRKWARMNPRYKQRLLMVFKIMRERYQYELVLLEGYRSPERQNLLSGNSKITQARAYQSYHQFGLAADIAFLRDGKVVISEQDPWAMRGYQRYGEIAESVGLTWGGRWKSIQDYGHSEYRLPNLSKTPEMAEKLTQESQFSAND